MAHSPVYFDGEAYVTLVSHVQFVNDIRIPDYVDPAWSCLSGLLEYSLRSGEGILRVYDIDDAEVYEVHNVEDWEGLDKDAVRALLDAVDGGSFVPEIGDQYRRILEVYRKTGDPQKAVGGHKIGTVVRIDYGYDNPGAADVALKIGDNAWHLTGTEDVWDDEEIWDYRYEVIYSV